MLSKQQKQKINKLMQQQFIRKFSVLAVALLVIGTVSYFGYKQNAASHAASGAVLSITPASTSSVIGSNLTVTLLEDSGTDPVNAVQTSLSYDSSKLQYVSINEGTAFPTVAATSTSTAGIIRVARGTLSGAQLTGSNTIATVTFKVLSSSGTTNISYDPAYSYVVRSTDSTNILTANIGSSIALKLPAPTVNTMTPTSGSTLGGTVVAINGSNFTSGAAVSANGVAATGVSVTSATTIVATLPAHVAGAVDITVTNPDGQSVKAGSFTYISPTPTISSVMPAAGVATGGTVVTIMGTNFVAPLSVTFGGMLAGSVSLVSSTQITAITPAHEAGAVPVAMTFPGITGAVTLNSAFTYTTPAPTISAISPVSGLISGGTTITVSGTNFVNVTKVTVGGTVATGLSVTNSSSLTIVAPAHASGAVDVAVTTAAGSVTKTNAFTYTNQAPLVTGISPGSGTSNGGTVVTISGSNFTSGASVTFGGKAATAVSVVSSTTIRATVPAGTVGASSLVVYNSDGQKATLAAAFTYLALGDANNDGRVNAIDLSILISHDGQNYPPADFNGDGTVGSADLAILLGRWTW